MPANLNTSPSSASAPWSAIGCGVLLSLAATRQRGWSAVGLALAGLALVSYGLRGMAGHAARERERYLRCQAHLSNSGAGVTSGIYDYVAQAAKEENHPAGTLIDDIVDEASDDSFPCSDPPAWTAR